MTGSFLGFDKAFVWTFAAMLGVLVVASIIGQVMGVVAKTDGAKATVRNMNQRIGAWWLIVVVFAVALAAGRIGAVILFAIVSFLALREFITLLPTRRADHRTLLWAFFILTPLQYLCVALGWINLFAIFIPVYAFLFVPISVVLRGDTERFLDRTAQMQWALMICVYCASYAPALLLLHPHGRPHEGAKLLLYLVIVVEISDVLQYVWGKLLGRHRMARPRSARTRPGRAFSAA